MNEIISGIQVIKMYAWEIPFEKVIKKVRSSEVADVQKVSYYRGLHTSFSLFLERTTLFLTITCFVLFGNHLTSDRAFSMAQFTNILLLIMGVYFPLTLCSGAECLTSIKRLRDFLTMEEKETAHIESSPYGCVEMNDVFASWVSSSPTLENLTLKIPPGILCAVVGPVGSGKSSLLHVT